MENQREWAIVTGSSGGIGYEIALELAKQGFNLILIARRGAKLKQLQSILHQYGSLCHYLVLDLSSPDAHITVKEFLSSQEISPYILVNNAGFGLFGEFMHQKPSEIEQMLMLNIHTLTLLTREIGVIIPNGGHILNVASTVCFVPVAAYSAYAATKSYVHAFSYALQAELSPRVSVSTLYPGMTNTAFFEHSHHKIAPWLKAIMMYQPNYVAAKGVRGMLKRKPRIIAGMLNHFLVLFMQLTPDRFNRWLLGNIFRLASR